MAFPTPPIRGGEVVPDLIGGVRSRVKAQETPVLPEPRTYYAQPTTGNTVLTTNTITNFGVTVPIFWRPGNTVGIMAQFTEISSAASTSTQLTINNSPIAQSANPPLIGAHTVPTGSGQTRVTTPVNTTGLGMTGFDFPAQFIYMTPHPVYTGATTAGIFNLQFKIQRTAGTGTVTANTLRVWIQVF